jgi:hypothetical protein
MNYNYGWTCRDLSATWEVALSDALDDDSDGDLDGVWNVCEGLTGAEAEAAGYGWCSQYDWDVCAGLTDAQAIAAGYDWCTT